MCGLLILRGDKSDLRSENRIRYLATNNQSFGARDLHNYD